MHRPTSVFRRQMSAKGVSTRKRTFTFIADMQFQALKRNHDNLAIGKEQFVENK